jgi:hypothetical protein
LSEGLDPEFREWLIKQKLSFSIGARFLVRFHVSLILAGSVLAGWAANRLLYLAGVKEMLVRHPAAIIAAYLGFLLGLQAWVRYSGIREYLGARRSKDLLEPEGFKAQPLPRTPEITGRTVAEALIAPEGCLLLIACLVIGAVGFMMGGYLIVYASELMAELVFELLLAAGLVKGIRRVDALSSIGVPTSIWALAAVLVASVIFALVAKGSYPHASTIGEVVRALTR